MNDPISDADKIRQKRLAKMQARSQSQTQAQATTEPVDNTTTKVAQSASGEGSSSNNGAAAVTQGTTATTQAAVSPEKAAASKPATTNPTTTQSRATRLSGESEPKRTKINITPVKPTETARSPSAVAAVPARPVAPTQTFEEWADIQLRHIFEITLHEPKESSRAKRGELFLVDMRNELNETGQELLFSLTLLDQVIMEAVRVAYETKKVLPLQYLLRCWHRASNHLRAVKPRDDPLHKDFFRDVKRLIKNYCAVSISMPEILGVELPESAESQQGILTSVLLADYGDSDEILDSELLNELVTDEDHAEACIEGFVTAFQEIGAHLTQSSHFNADFKSAIFATRLMCENNRIVDAVTSSPSFLGSDVTAPELGKATLLGPLFTISPLQQEYYRTTYKEAALQVRGQAREFLPPQIRDIQVTQNLSLRAHLDDLLYIVNKIIRASPRSRERMLDWFAACMNLNVRRSGIQWDPKLVSSDGFMHNVSVILDRLCEPFMDNTFAKVDRIDVDYFRRNPRIDIKENTKINADQQRSDSFYQDKVDGESNFITEIFFLGLAGQQYGTQSLKSKLKRLEKDLEYMDKHIKMIEAERVKWINTPRYNAYLLELEKFKDVRDNAAQYQLAIGAALNDDLAQTRYMQSMRYTAVWLERLVTHLNYPQENVQLPLNEEQPEAFRCLPEYFVENIANVFKYIIYYMPQLVSQFQVDEIATFCITMLRSPDYIKNPYLKSKLVTILCYGSRPLYSRGQGVMGPYLSTNKVATDQLLHALIRFYVDIEHTGEHNQFLDKFTIRYEIFQIIEKVWEIPVYRKNLSEESRVNNSLFVKFVNLLLNDSTYVLDEAFTALGKIRTLQYEMTQPETPENPRAQQEENFATQERIAGSYMQLVNETLKMLRKFTGAITPSFTVASIVQRLADMLNLNLETLVGPKGKNLRVTNPEKYSFRPKQLLADLVSIYLNLSKAKAFTEAVVKDGRSYKRALFDQTIETVQKNDLLSPDSIRAFKKFVGELHEAEEVLKAGEEELGDDIPDEFLDPLLFHLMSDPVILPASKISVDRSTIESHLLSFPHDPFNRTPLTLDQVLPDEELRKKIESWVKEKRAKGKDVPQELAIVADEEASKMDTTE